ncbi:MAG TPA: PDZ domain-containing protein [Thermoanaerobaculia bacterium]
MRWALIAVAILCVSAAPAPRPGWLGLGFTYHTKVERGRVHGWLFVRHVAPHGPAARAGLRPRDVVTHLGGVPLAFPTEAALFARLQSVRAGQTVVFTVRRGEERLHVKVVPAPMTDDQWAAWQRSRAE